MKVGITVEGRVDRLFLDALRRRVCPDADSEVLQYRGSLELGFVREIRKIVRTAEERGCDVVVVMTDSNCANWRDSDNPEWRDCLKALRGSLPTDTHIEVIVACPDRNIECWIAAVDHACRRALEMDTTAVLAGSDDPSEAVKAALDRLALKKEEEGALARLVATPGVLREWVNGSRSFKEFYEDIRLLAKRRGCVVPNPLDE
jgi:hypothetical protein